MKNDCEATTPRHSEQRHYLDRHRSDDALPGHARTGAPAMTMTLFDRRWQVLTADTNHIVVLQGRRSCGTLAFSDVSPADRHQRICARPRRTPTVLESILRQRRQDIDISYSVITAPVKTAGRKVRRFKTLGSICLSLRGKSGTWWGRRSETSCPSCF